MTLPKAKQSFALENTEPGSIAARATVVVVRLFTTYFTKHQE